MLEGFELAELLLRIADWRALAEASRDSKPLVAPEEQRMHGLSRLFANPEFDECGRQKARRMFDRLRVAGSARLLGGQSDETVELADVSAGGACVSVAGEPPPLGAELRIEVPLEGKDCVSFGARVIWIGRERHKRIGLAFTDAGAKHSVPVAA